MQVCRYAKMTRRGWLDEGKQDGGQAASRGLWEECLQQQCRRTSGPESPGV